MGLMRALQRAQIRQVEKALELSTKAARASGDSIAGVMIAYRPTGRVYTTEDIEKACEVVSADLAEKVFKGFDGSGLPADTLESMVRPLLKRNRAEFRRALCAALPADMIASQGTG